MLDLYCISVTQSTATGPISPDDISGEFALYVLFGANVTFFIPGCWSPINRLGHKFTTLIDRRFVPARTASVISTRYGGFHAIPAVFPFTATSAIS